MFSGPIVLADGHDAQLRSTLNSVLEEYKFAILSVDGARAYATLSRGTRDFWDELHRATQEYDRQAILDAPYAIKMSVLGARAMVDRDVLINGNSRDMFIAFVDTKQLGYRSVGSLGIAEIRSNGSVVKAELAQDGKPTGAYLLEFVEEADGWRFHTIPMFMAGGAMLASMVAKQGMNEDEFIILVIEKETGKTVDGSIWDPLVP